MINRLFALVVVLLMGMTGSVFAGAFSGVGGDADYFPRSGPIVSAFIVPVLNLENTSAGTIFGLEAVLGWSDLSFSLKYGKQGNSNFAGLGLRKKIISENYLPFSCTLIFDDDGILGQNTGVYGSYLGAIFSKKIDNIYPYLALLSTVYYTRTDLGVGPITYQYIYGSGLAGGARYDYDDHLSFRGEVNYNQLLTSTAAPWPKSILSIAMYASWRR